MGCFGVLLSEKSRLLRPDWRIGRGLVWLLTRNSLCNSRAKSLAKDLGLNVPDRYIGHRVCPHIWAPRPAWTAQPAPGQVRWAKSPVAQIPCLSPYPGHHAPFRAPS